MKRFLMIGAAALLMTTASGFTVGTEKNVEVNDSKAESTEKPNYTKYKFNCKNFNKLDLSRTVKAKVIKSDTYKVEVTLPTEFKEYLKVYVKDGELRIRMSDDLNFNARIQNKYKNWSFTAVIAMPELRGLEMSGASEFECEDTFDLGRENFSLELSGASKVKSLNVNGVELDAEISGAAAYKFAGNFKRAYLEVSGAAEGQWMINADYMELEASGAGKTKLNGDFGHIRLDASGACDIALNGAAERLEVDASGACNVRAMGLKSQHVFVDAAGACNCHVYPEHSLTIDNASGAATVRYKAPKDMGVRLNSISRAATVKRVE